jgi:hypothetical protein
LWYITKILLPQNLDSEGDKDFSKLAEKIRNCEHKKAMRFHNKHYVGATLSGKWQAYTSIKTPWMII